MTRVRKNLKADSLPVSSAAKSSALPPRAREKAETTILPHHSFAPSIHNHGKAPPAFLTAFSESSTPIVSFLKTKKARKTFRTFLPNQMKFCVYFGNINKPLCARGQRETSSLKSKYRAMLTSCRYKNDQGGRVVCMKDRFARKPARARSYRAAHGYRK